MGLVGAYDELDRVIGSLERMQDGELQAAIVADTAEEFLDFVKEGFTSSTDPYGWGWAELKYRDGMPLRDNGHLGSGFTVVVSGTAFTISNPVPYGVHHQFGAPLANIPARPMLPFDGEMPEQWEDAAREIASEVLKGEF